MRKYLLLPLALVGVLAGASSARADLVIKITQGVQAPTPIAVVPFAWSGAGSAPVDVAQVIGDDLARSGLFAPLPAAKMLARPSSGDDVHFGNWQAVNVNDLVVGSITPAGAGAQIRFQLFNVYTKQQLLGYVLPAQTGDLRFAAHNIADMIYEKLTGNRGAFATQIAYVRHSGAGNNQNWELIVADSDGANAQVVVKSPDLLMSPVWSPGGSRLAYVEFQDHESHIYVQNVKTGKRKLVLARPGVNGAPAFSPGGGRLAVVCSTKPGDPDIYLLDLASGKLRQLTHSPAIDTEPAWMPDGKSLIFTSDRGGSPQLYQMQVAPGAKAERITWDGSYNARAAVSPDGKTVALVHRENGSLKIALLDLTTGNMRMLTNGPSDLSPSFAPNGAMILYSTRVDDQRVLATASVDGQVREQLSGGAGDLSQPAWGPFPKGLAATPQGGAQ